MNTNLLILISFLLMTSSVNAKFSVNVFKTPCEELILEISKCENKVISNKSALPSHQKKRKDIIFTKEGSMVQAKILSRKAVKCSENQKMDLSMYKKRKIKKNKNFFINRQLCDSSRATIKVHRPNFYCDTPGAPTIFACYMSSLEFKKKFTYTNVVPRTDPTLRK